MLSIPNYLDISIPDQRLTVYREGEISHSYPVSTALKGPGEIKGSECTPRGWHRIRACIGRDLPAGTVFKARRPTGEIYTPELAALYPDRDWILTRILWLDGMEPGHNRYGLVNTGSRYIYLHGSPDEAVQGVPASHGCIRMLSQDLIQLFDGVSAGWLVYIHE